jgi:NAD(P)-dependent dehydrogenase (short-subunit alcohol dehydrogenase family)
VPLSWLAIAVIDPLHRASSGPSDAQESGTTWPTHSFDIPDSWGLNDKVAIVTGGGAAGDGIGNGRAAALLLARAGTRVIVVDRDVALAKRTVEMIEAGGGQGLAFQADMTRASDCAAVVEAAMDRYGRLIIWTTTSASAAAVSSSTDRGELAAAHERQRGHDVPRGEARDPAMRRTGGGAIVNVSSSPRCVRVVSPPTPSRRARSSP